MLRQRIEALLGPGGVLGPGADAARYERDLLGACAGRAAFVARPRSTREAAGVVRLCAEAGAPLVPAGGLTGFCGGAMPGGGEVVVSLERMHEVRALDPVNNALAVDAGMTLAAVQQLAQAHDRLFPLRHGGQGSAQVGGSVSTNAGGNAVLRYGNMRELVLGLEVVLPDGSVLDAMRALRKDNSGYDLKQLFIGAEGTLGIVTGAVLKLFPAPKRRETALAAGPTPSAMVTLLERCRAAAGETISAFELIPRIGLERHFAHSRSRREPFAHAHPWHALVELESTSERFDLRGVLEDVLGAAIAEGAVHDALVAQSDAQRGALWALREGLALAAVADPSSLKNDTAVPTSAIAQFIEEAAAAVEALVPGAQPMPFGHIGDGNIHFNLWRPEDTAPGAFVALWPRLVEAIERIALRLGGSISAEHGIGRAKIEALRATKPPEALALMRSLKAALDPRGLMNPGKLVPW